MVGYGLWQMVQMKSTELTPNKLTQIIKSIGILVLISTSIFACKQRKKRVSQEKEIVVPIETTKVNKIDTPLKSAPHIIPISELYVRSCGVCHQAYPKEKYSNESWGHILDSMQKRAHISNADKYDLYVFLTGDTLSRKK